MAESAGKGSRSGTVSAGVSVAATSACSGGGSTRTARPGVRRLPHLCRARSPSFLQARVSLDETLARIRRVPTICCLVSSTIIRQLALVCLRMLKQSDHSGAGFAPPRRAGYSVLPAAAWCCDCARINFTTACRSLVRHLRMPGSQPAHALSNSTACGDCHQRLLDIRQ